MQDFGVKCGIFQEKTLDFGVKSGIFQEKMHDLRDNGVFLERNCVILGIMGDFPRENA